MNIFEELLKEKTEKLTKEIIDEYGNMADNPGVYLIRNIKNGKVYIGQTNNLKIRKQSHFSDLKANIHHNKHLQNAWNKYGAENFEFEVLEECSLEKLDEVEIYWIKYYESYNRKFGYNFELGGNNSPQTQEIRDKIDSTIELRKQKIFEDRFGIIEEMGGMTFIVKCIKEGKTQENLSDELNLPKSFIVQYLSLHNLKWSQLYGEVREQEKFNIITENGGLHFIINCILKDWSKKEICNTLQIRNKDLDAYLESFNLNYKEINKNKTFGEYNRVIERFGGKQYLIKNIKLGVSIQELSEEMRIPLKYVNAYIKENNINLEN